MKPCSDLETSMKTTSEKPDQSFKSSKKKEMISLVYKVNTKQIDLDKFDPKERKKTKNTLKESVDKSRSMTKKAASTLSKDDADVTA